LRFQTLGPRRKNKNRFFLLRSLVLSDTFIIDVKKVDYFRGCGGNPVNARKTAFLQEQGERNEGFRFQVADNEAGFSAPHF